MKSSRLALATAVLLSLSACAVGPNYTRPPVEAPADYRGAAAPSDEKPFADLPWWEVFQDSTLKGLVEEALAANYDARIAAARVERARYSVGVTRADLMPQVGYTGEGDARQILRILGLAERDGERVSRGVPDGLGDRRLGAHSPRD